MAIIDLAGNPLAKKEEKKKEPSPLSMRTGDMLAQMEGSSPIAASSMMRALGDVERQRGQNERGLAMLQHKQEAEVDDQKDDEAPLSIREWAQRHYKSQLAKYPVKNGVRRVPKRLDKRIREGYALYFKRHYIRVKSQQESAFNRARIAKEQALAGSYGRANRPTDDTTTGVALGRMLNRNPNLLNDPNWRRRAIELLGRQKHPGSLGAAEARGKTPEQATGLIDRRAEEAHDRALALAGGKERQALTLADRKYGQARGLATHKAALKGKVETPLVPDASIRKVIVAGKNIGKVGKGGEKIDFQTWMHESYLPIAQSITPEQRAAIVKAVGNQIPSEDELLGMLQVPTGKPSRLFGLIGAQPPSREAVEGGFDELDYVLEALRLRGASDAKIQQLRTMFSDRLLDAREAPTGG
jgi:hypothetical protein